MEKPPAAENSNERSAEHNKILTGMFARLESGELAKILETDERAKVATVQVGANGDVEHIPYDKLATLVTTTSVTEEWERGSEGMKKAA